MKNKKRKKEFAKNKFGPKFDLGFFVFSFFNAESKNRFSVFGLKRKKEKGALFPFFRFFVLTEKRIILWYPDRYPDHNSYDYVNYFGFLLLVLFYFVSLLKLTAAANTFHKNAQLLF